MKMTNQQLRTIIKEELKKVLDETFLSGPTRGDLQRLKHFFLEVKLNWQSDT